MLTRRQRESLAAIVDTFLAPIDLPGGSSTPAGSKLGVVELVERAVAQAPRSADGRQTALLLGLFGSRPVTALGGGRGSRFGDLPLEAREAVLRSWADSRIPQRRAVFQALRKAALGMAYMAPGDGSPNPLLDMIGYPSARVDAGTSCSWGPPSEWSSRSGRDARASCYLCVVDTNLCPRVALGPQRTPDENLGLPTRPEGRLEREVTADPLPRLAQSEPGTQVTTLELEVADLLAPKATPAWKEPRFQLADLLRRPGAMAASTLGQRPPWVGGSRASAMSPLHRGRPHGAARQAPSLTGLAFSRGMGRVGRICPTVDTKPFLPSTGSLAKRPKTL